MTRIALAGGYPYERDLITSWLADVPGIQAVVGVVADDVVRHPRPADLLVGVMGDDAREALAHHRDLARLHGCDRVVAILRSPTSQLIEGLAASGADAMVAMDSGQRALRAAIQCVREGGAWLDPQLSHLVLSRLGREPDLDNDLGLTAREFEVALHFPQGRTRGEIAEALGVTEETVKTHIGSIYAKLGVNDRSAAARLIQSYVARRGDGRVLVGGS